MQVLNLSCLGNQIDDRTLATLCHDNPDARLKTNSQGELIIMPPTGSETGDRNLELAFGVKLWNKQSKLGKVFDSSTGFRLSNNAVRSPDVSWVKIERWNSLTKEEKRKFAPLDPDFVLELMSPTDELEQLQNKMKEYINCGVRLGWLINPDVKQVEIYRQDRNKEVLDKPLTLSGENIMPKLLVNLSEIFE